MNVPRRLLADRGFTALSLASVALISLALVVVLVPMIYRGATAVVFRGTAAFRQMQFEMHDRGDPGTVQSELAEVAKARAPVYDLLDRFGRGIDTEHLEDEARQVYQDLGKDLERQGIRGDERLEVRRLGRTLRDALVEAFESADKDAAREKLAFVLSHQNDDRINGTSGERFFRMARDYGDLLKTVDLGRRDEYAQALAEVQDALVRLFGPRPGTDRPPLAMHRYGATRMDMAERALDDFLFAERWVKVEGQKSLVRQRIPREEQFAGTPLATIFPMVRENVEVMLRPRLTFYWQYLLDDSVPGHFFGGVGPEILGTLVITVLAIATALPLGVIAAAYLVEVAGNSWLVRGLRMCINTLAGVPSIVFGLFGLAFVVLWLLPRLGLEGKPCVLAAGMTLAVLVLPVVIRASEEAIRAVPSAYKEAALALGAGRLRCFLTVQLPAALPGILTGVILSMSRAAGETAPILFTGAVAVGPALRVLDFSETSSGWFDWLFEPTRTLSYGSYDLAVGDRVAAMVPHQQYGMVATLIVLVLLLNTVAIVIRWRISKRLRGQ